MLHILYLNGQYTILCQNRSHEKTAYRISKPSIHESGIKAAIFFVSFSESVQSVPGEWSADRTRTLNGPT